MNVQEIKDLGLAVTHYSPAGLGLPTLALWRWEWPCSRHQDTPCSAECVNQKHKALLTLNEGACGIYCVQGIILLLCHHCIQRSRGKTPG